MKDCCYLVTAVEYDKDGKPEHKIVSEWKCGLYKTFEEADEAVNKYNQTHSQKIETFEKRTGGTIVEAIADNEIDFFNY